MVLLTDLSGLTLHGALFGLLSTAGLDGHDDKGWSTHDDTGYGCIFVREHLWLGLGSRIDRSSRTMVST
jgi:hypothetical protein